MLKLTVQQQPLHSVDTSIDSGVITKALNGLEDAGYDTAIKLAEIQNQLLRGESLKNSIANDNARLQLERDKFNQARLDRQRKENEAKKAKLAAIEGLKNSLGYNPNQDFRHDVQVDQEYTFKGIDSDAAKKMKEEIDQNPSKYIITENPSKIKPSADEFSLYNRYNDALKIKDADKRILELAKLAKENNLYNENAKDNGGIFDAVGSFIDRNLLVPIHNIDRTIATNINTIGKDRITAAEMRLRREKENEQYKKQHNIVRLPPQLSNFQTKIEAIKKKVDRYNQVKKNYDSKVGAQEKLVQKYMKPIKAKKKVTIKSVLDSRFKFEREWRKDYSNAINEASKRIKDVDVLASTLSRISQTFEDAKKLYYQELKSEQDKLSKLDAMKLKLFMKKREQELMLERQIALEEYKRNPKNEALQRRLKELDIALKEMKLNKKD